MTSRPRRGLVLLALLLATLATGALALPSLRDMSHRHVAILDFELARTAEKASAYDARLGNAGRDTARESLYLDYPFLILYGLLLSATCAVVVARAAEHGMARLVGAGRPLVWAGLAAAACDAIENLALLRILDGHTAQPWPGIAFGLASAKFLLILTAVLYAITGFLQTRRGKRR